jgi:archaemetzincin
MQGSASPAEDVRQPPYLCPVDLAKVLRATGADMDKRYTALLGFCEEHGEDAMFAAFATWIRTRMLEVQDEQDGILQ